MRCSHSAVFRASPTSGFPCRGMHCESTRSMNSILDVDRKTFEGAPDFDKDNWPDDGRSGGFGHAVHKHYGQRPYWEHAAADGRVPLPGRRKTASDRRAETRH